VGIGALLTRDVRHRSLRAARALVVATGPKVAPISFVLGLGAAAAIGGVLGWQTRRHVMWSAMRQVFVVSLAAGLTFLVGWLLGTATS
jgi:VIT1/CCC1 family predicted Fe2+/Mn2+ transporter